MRKPRPNQRGFTLLTVMLVLVLLLTVLITTLGESSEALSGAVFYRDRELMGAAVDVGVAAGIDQLATLDRADIIGLGDIEDVAPPFDIFTNWGAGNFVPELPYPPVGTAGEAVDIMRVRVGAVRGQRVRPPPGEDVRTAYGSVVHLQISVRSNRPGAALEQRYEVGVRVPEAGSYQ